MMREEEIFWRYWMNAIKFAPRSLRANYRLVIGMTLWVIQRLLMPSWIDLYTMLTISIWPANH